MTRTTALLAAIVSALAVSAAPAAELIGAATEAKNDVTGTLDQLVRTINTGDGVSANEIVKTGAGSATLITFLDDTSLAIGASSTIVLDSFVYNPEGNADQAVINLTKGAFRFVTGKSDPSKFTIRTEVATLGILGTDFVVLCDGEQRCGVVVAKGKVKICPRPDLPFDCEYAFALDIKKNAALIGANGETTGPRSIPSGLVKQIVAAVGAGKDGLVPGVIAAGFHRPQPPAPKPVNGTPG